MSERSVDDLRIDLALRAAELRGLRRKLRWSTFLLCFYSAVVMALVAVFVWMVSEVLR